MVGEFPELQGVIGGYLASAQGETGAVANAIRDQYRPLGQGDETPSELPSIAVAIAEKLDTLVGFFGIDQPPTGSKDPFALRRAALGVIRLITENGLRVRLLELFPGAAQLYRNSDLNVREAGPELLAFFADRLKVQQRDAGVRHDLIDAVFALGGEDDLVRLLARVNALQSFIETEDGTNLLVAYKRAANILKKEKWEGTGTPGGSDLDPEERALVETIDKAEPKASAAIAQEDFTGAMAALASLRKPIDDFFDNVTVNDADPAKRERRLNLLMRFRDAVNAVADFSRIES
jgi:glycyl-tRNA synthetase beta chain